MRQYGTGGWETDDGRLWFTRVGEEWEVYAHPEKEDADEVSAISGMGFSRTFATRRAALEAANTALVSSGLQPASEPFRRVTRSGWKLEIDDHAWRLARGREGWTASYVSGPAEAMESFAEEIGEAEFPTRATAARTVSEWFEEWDSQWSGERSYRARYTPETVWLVKAAYPAIRSRADVELTADRVGVEPRRLYNLAARLGVRRALPWASDR